MHVDQESPKFVTIQRSITEIQLEQESWVQHNFPDSTLQHATLGAAEEVGELCHAVLKAAQGIRGIPEEHRDEIRDAIGDIVIYLADICTKTNQSLWDCILETWLEVRQRDWQKFPQNGVSE